MRIMHSFVGSSKVTQAAKALLIAGIVVFAMSSTAYSATTIDDFSTGAFTLTGSSGGGFVSATQGPLANVHLAGGYRQLRFEVPPSPSGTVTTDVDSAKQRFDYIANAAPTETRPLSAINFKVLYNGSDTLNSGMDLDLTADGSNALAFNFEFANFANGYGTFDIFLTSSSGGVYVYQRVSNSTAPFTVGIPFNISTGGGNTFDPAHFTSMSFGTSNGNLAGQFTIDSITTTTVPEPSAGLVAAAAFLAALPQRRKKQSIHESAQA